MLHYLFLLYMRLINILRVNLYIFLVLLSSSGLTGQKLQIEGIQLPEGKVLSMITGIDQDEFGYLWLATHNDGLVRYDGQDFESFRPPDDPLSRSGFFLEALEIDEEGFIWVGDFYTGLYRFDPQSETFTTYTHDPADPNSLSNNHIRYILQDSQGTLWVGTQEGVDTVSRDDGKFYHISGSSGEFAELGKAHIRTILEDSQGTIWFGSGSPISGDDPYPEYNGLYELDRSTGELKKHVSDPDNPNSLMDDHVGALFEDSRGVFWVGTAGDGLHTLNRKTGEFTRHLSDPERPHKLSRPNYFGDGSEDHIRVINEDEEGNIWIATLYGGMSRYNPATNYMDVFSTNEEGHNKVNRNDHWTGFKSENGILWIASAWNTSEMTELLYRISYNKTDKYHNNIETRGISFWEAPDKSLWIGAEHGLFRRNADGSHTRYLNDPNPNALNNIIIDIAPGPDNLVYVGTVVGVYSFDLVSHEFKEIESSEKVVTLQVLYDEGKLWIGTNPGLDRIDLETNELVHLHNANGDSAKLRNRPIHRILSDDNNNVWVSGVDGVFRFSPENIGPQIYVQNKIYSTILIDNETFWAGSESGLSQLDPKTGAFNPVMDSTLLLSDNRHIADLVKNGDNSLAILRDTDFILLDLKTKDAVYFGESWFQGNQSLSNREILSTSEGKLVIGNENGYFLFDPSEFNAEKVQPKPFIKRFFVGSEELAAFNPREILTSDNPAITLNYDQNNITIQYGNVDFFSKGKEKNLTYKLENFDYEWQLDAPGQKAAYYGLPKGEYLFRVKAANEFGETAEKTLRVIIKPPWYFSWWAYLFYGIVFILLLMTIHRIQRTRTIAQERRRSEKKELEQAREIEKAYNELKATQKQLIQSEKMASLGELTAGIAHEIQNPLNFVNNFADVNMELLQELKEEVQAGNTDEVNALANDLIENEEKIVHHGKRAEEIVKSMLQHSRGTEGKKEPTDVNVLADEYLRLAYHGMRAKDKSFNVTMDSEFDEKVPELLVVPQDIGRVLLNLITNAFHAVAEKKSQTAGDYQPAVNIKTKLENNQVVITVADNGAGIPDSIRQKVFEPFFSTKKAGEGTGLGLSLSYDIITKGHNGTISVESNEGLGTTFTIILPA